MILIQNKSTFLIKNKFPLASLLKSTQNKNVTVYGFGKLTVSLDRLLCCMVRVHENNCATKDLACFCQNLIFVDVDTDFFLL